jgi:hypothetical protein
VLVAKNLIIIQIKNVASLPNQQYHYIYISLTSPPLHVYVIERASKYDAILFVRGLTLFRLPSILMFFLFCIIGKKKKTTFPVQQKIRNRKRSQYETQKKVTNERASEYNLIFYRFTCRHNMKSQKKRTNERASE